MPSENFGHFCKNGECTEEESSLRIDKCASPEQCAGDQASGKGMARSPDDDLSKLDASVTRLREKCQLRILSEPGFPFAPPDIL